MPKRYFALMKEDQGTCHALTCWAFEEPIFCLLDFLQLEKMILGSNLNRSLWNLFCPCSKLYLLSESHISVGLWKQLFILVGKGPGLKNVPDRHANNTQYSLLAATSSHWESYRLLKYWVGMLWLPWENNVQVGYERYNLLPSLHGAPCPLRQHLKVVSSQRLGSGVFSSLNNSVVSEESMQRAVVVPAPLPPW